MANWLLKLATNWFSPRTISFWAAVIGVATWKKRKLSITLMSLVGFGGMGVAYGRFADKNGLPIEPVPVFTALFRREGVDYAKHIREGRDHAIWAGVATYRLWSGK